MKSSFRILLLLFIAATVFSCNKPTPDPDPIVYNSSGSIQFASSNTLEEDNMTHLHARISDNNAFTLQAKVGSERVMLFCDDFMGTGDYLSGGSSTNIFVHTFDNDVNLIGDYLTSVNAPEGVLTLSNYDSANGSVTGSFEFSVLDENGELEVVSGSFENIIVRTNTYSGVELTNRNYNSTGWTGYHGGPGAIIYKDINGPGSFTLFTAFDNAKIWLVKGSAEDKATLFFDENFSPGTPVKIQRVLRPGEQLQFNSIQDGNSIKGDFAYFNEFKYIAGTFSHSTEIFDDNSYVPTNRLVLDNFTPNISAQPTDIDFSQAFILPGIPGMNIITADSRGNYIQFNFDEDVSTGSILNNTSGSEFFYRGYIYLANGERIGLGGYDSANLELSESQIEIIEHDFDTKKIVGQYTGELATGESISLIFDLNY